MLNRPLSFDAIPLVPTVEELMPILSIGRSTAVSLVRFGQIRRHSHWQASFTFGLVFLYPIPHLVGIYPRFPCAH